MTACSLHESATPYVPKTRSMPVLQRAARTCRGCPLYKTATQTVFGEAGAYEIEACRPWLDAELFALKPDVLVCLGATAAQALLGAKFKVTTERGKAVTSELAPHVLATVHPSSILRSRTDEERARAFAAFVGDLKVAAKFLRPALRSQAR